MQAGRPEATGLLAERVCEVLSTQSNDEARRRDAAELPLDLGDPLRAVALLDQAVGTPAVRHIQRWACYEAAAALRSGAAAPELPSAFTKRMARLPPFRADEIRAAYRQINGIFEPIDALSGPNAHADFTLSYTIWMTPHSGSTHLVKVMTDAGVFGRPH